MLLFRCLGLRVLGFVFIFTVVVEDIRFFIDRIVDIELFSVISV